MNTPHDYRPLTSSSPAKQSAGTQPGFHLPIAEPAYPTTFARYPAVNIPVGVPVNTSLNDVHRRYEEGTGNYVKGGYHSVMIGEVYNNRYQIVKKLGWGHFSTVWLAVDLHVPAAVSRRVVAIKVQKSAPSYAEAAVDEVSLLIKGGGRVDTVVRLLDHFQVQGSNGRHHCMVFEALGPNLLTFVQSARRMNYNGKHVIPPVIVQRIVYELLTGLHFLHVECGIIHTDLKPENILLVSDMISSLLVSPNTVRNYHGPLVKIVDLGNACWTHTHFTDYITTRQYRSPEAIVELKYTTKVDIWALGCIVYELLTGEYLFDPHEDAQKRFTRDDDHLALMIEILGTPPACIVHQGHRSLSFFRPSGALKRIRCSDIVGWPLEAMLAEKFASFGPGLERKISKFLAGCLKMDPHERLSAKDALDTEWMRDFIKEGTA